MPVGWQSAGSNSSFGSCALAASMNRCLSSSRATMLPSTPSPTVTLPVPVNNPGIPSTSTREPNGSVLVTVARTRSPGEWLVANAFHRAAIAQTVSRRV